MGLTSRDQGGLDLGQLWAEEKISEVGIGFVRCDGRAHRMHHPQGFIAAVSRLLKITADRRSLNC